MCMMQENMCTEPLHIKLCTSTSFNSLSRTGDGCDVLDLIPSPRTLGYHAMYGTNSTSTWGGSVVRGDDGSWHMYVNNPQHDQLPPCADVLPSHALYDDVPCNPLTKPWHTFVKRVYHHTVRLQPSLCPHFNHHSTLPNPNHHSVQPVTLSHLHHHSTQPVTMLSLIITPLSPTTTADRSAAEMVGDCGINVWLSNSRVVHAVSTDMATSPFVYAGEVHGVFSHEPIAKRAPTG
jgi:hypothetical protein